MKTKVTLENEVYRKIMYWVNKSNYEVSGLGTVKVMPGGEFRVTSAMLLPQKNGATHTDIEPEDVNRALFALRHSEGDLRFWWHSHVNMGVFWSGTDTDTIKKIGEGGWVLSSVFNKKREIKSAFYSRVSPWGDDPVFIDDLETKVLDWEEPQIAEWDKEYDDNVKITPFVSTYTHGWMGKEWDKELGDWREPAGKPPGHKPWLNGNQTEGGTGRPSGVSKREWRKIKKELTVAALIPEAIEYEDEQEEKDEHVKVFGDLDVYGFTKEERQKLARYGVDESEIDGMIANGFTPQEMLEEIENWEDVGALYQEESNA